MWRGKATYEWARLDIVYLHTSVQYGNEDGFLATVFDSIMIIIRMLSLAQ